MIIHIYAVGQPTCSVTISSILDVHSLGFRNPSELPGWIYGIFGTSLHFETPQCTLNYLPKNMVLDEPTGIAKIIL
jgi:hypothetical protein